MYRYMQVYKAQILKQYLYISHSHVLCVIFKRPLHSHSLSFSLSPKYVEGGFGKQLPARDANLKYQYLSV